MLQINPDYFYGRNSVMLTVFLCGFMGCGKTTIGKELATMLGVSYADMDEHIVKKAGKSIPQIFTENGEEYFRRLETDAVRELALKGGVISCGGGAMLKKENAEIANKNGVVVYIDVSFETCYSRIRNDQNRPIVVNNTKEQLEDIYNSRIPLYLENSRITADGNDTPYNIARKIAAELSAEI
jgi:shikimate kinase